MERPQRATIRFTLIAIGLALFGSTHATGTQALKTDAQLRQSMISASIASYSGSCPCPYNTDRAGRRCGRRSAYSRPGGRSPLCYPEDITKKMLDDYRKKSAR